VFKLFPGTQRVARRLKFGSNGQVLQRDTFRYDLNGSRNWVNTDSAWWILPGDSVIALHRPDGRFVGVPNFPFPLFHYDGLGRLVGKRDSLNHLQQLIVYDGDNVAGIVNGYGAAEFLSGPGIDDPLMAYVQDPDWCTGTLGPSNEKYFLTVQGRFLHFHNARGQDCKTEIGGSPPQPLVPWAWEQAGRHAGAAQNSFGFGVGRSTDADVGMSYFRNRWYDARIGRFTQEDPLGYAGGENLYAYSGNNPASFTDPFGLCPEFLTGRPCSGALATAVGFIPVVGDAIDIIGAVVGQDLLTGESIFGLGIAATVLGTVVGSGRLAREAGDLASDYVNVTRRSARVWNRATNVGAGDFGAGLVESGFERTTRADGISVFTNGNRRYVVRGPERSNSGWTADVYVDDEMVGKIRLGGK
jgi:RHS repeat-associated protein